MSGFGISILRLTMLGWRAASRSLFQLCESLLRTFDPARLRSFIKFACLGKIAGDSACAPRLQHAGIVSLGQHKGSSRAAALKSVFKQGSSAADVGLLEQGVCSTTNCGAPACHPGSRSEGSPNSKEANSRFSRSLKNRTELPPYTMRA